MKIDKTIHDVNFHSIHSKKINGIVKAMGLNGSVASYRMLQSMEYHTVSERKSAMKKLECIWGSTITCFHVEIK